MELIDLDILDSRIKAINKPTTQDFLNITRQMYEELK